MQTQIQKDENEVLSAVVMMERILTRTNPNSRETIRRTSLEQIKQSLELVLVSLNTRCDTPLVLTPIMEIISLIDTVCSSDTFTETDSATKGIIVERLNTALMQLYLFAGKYYMEHKFTFMMSKYDVLRNIVDNCIDMGFYFGYDVKLREQGLL